MTIIELLIITLIPFFTGILGGILLMNSIRKSKQIIHNTKEIA
jgi:ABC-type antimicrobial peptide transport system permease subunit